MLTLEKEYIKRKTVEDFRKMEEGEYCQLINGEIIMSPSPSSKHQEVLATIFNAIYNHTKQEKSGKTFCAPMDVYFDEKNAYQPDILFVSKQRLHIIKEDGMYGAPDLIIEILSSSNSYSDTKTKKKIYEKYGVKEYWIADPMDGEVIGYENTHHSFKEFFRGNCEFTIKLLNLKLKFEI